jgi:hypothetical protein
MKTTPKVIRKSKSEFYKIVFSSILFFNFSISIAQVGIGTTTPDSSSMLEINSNSKGILIPRINLASIVDTATIPSPATSLLVYNTNAAINFGSGVGYYFWKGTQWEKLQTPSDDLWSRSATGSLFPKTLSDNVGINTTNPTSKLNVNGQVTIDQKNFGGYGGLLIKGDAPGSNYPNIAFSILNTNGDDKVAGYIGGNINDNTAGSEAMDLTFLTSTSGLGGLSEKMRIKDNGNVGIGTSSPTQKLEINGKIKITDGTQLAGRILSSDANGVGTWVNSTATTPAVAGVFAGPGASFGTTISVGSAASPMNYCNTYIDLPRGKWMVFGTYLLAGNSSLTSGQSCFIRSTFCLSSTVALANPDIISGSLISGIISGPNQFGIANGQSIINNSSSPVNGPPKRYYMWANIEKFGTTPTTFGMNGVGSSFWGENQLFAIPMN